MSAVGRACSVLIMHVTRSHTVLPPHGPRCSSAPTFGGSPFSVRSCLQMSLNCGLSPMSHDFFAGPSLLHWPLTGIPLQMQCPRAVPQVPGPHFTRHSALRMKQCYWVMGDEDASAGDDDDDVVWCKFCASRGHGIHGFQQQRCTQSRVFVPAEAPGPCFKPRAALAVKQCHGS
eukprot:CAMPEP_0174348756 /NCGR_PEP_ID=MMETSP0811_2-20130205/5327_1 /TAXON_ID=73025 ORGANISM="Eutreptiella gymnastica-like, Strain CCMP1594" /NCGR_SAMPLE_ID=MMETSP0811_2 /ASSEMBLY_ACC=CAM_ASM_000667 /LENGTH=173 /DNA_ID=CAMNT_0015475589 /DNA_START=94 /DNA_END=616 /DNA_ORIENTATION=-